MVEKEKDIVARLRFVCDPLMEEAAETIENCRDEIERLRKALGFFIATENEHTWALSRDKAELAARNTLGQGGQTKHPHSNPPKPVRTGRQRDDHDPQ